MQAALKMQGTLVFTDLRLITPPTPREALRLLRQTKKRAHLPKRVRKRTIGALTEVCSSALLDLQYETAVKKLHLEQEISHPDNSGIDINSEFFQPKVFVEDYGWSIRNPNIPTFCIDIARRGIHQTLVYSRSMDCYGIWISYNTDGTLTAFIRRNVESIKVYLGHRFAPTAPTPQK